ncbi:MAG: methyltransferase type 11 [Ilumatobacteraceae bacterium]|nr:methyltransferase type 11 [Ilumatobacteraceae bacterium]
MAAAGESHWWYDSTRHLVRDLIEEHLSALGDAALVLDAAGGTAATGGWMTTYATSVLADYEPMALEVARKDFASSPHPLRPVRADLNHLPFADDSFDAVLCVTALYHRMNPDPAAVVRDFARVVKPGGLVCLMEPGGKRLWRGHDEVTHSSGRFSVGEMKAMVVDAGLDLQRATGAYSFLVPPAFIMGRLERGAPKSDVSRNGSGLGGVLSVVARLERRLLRHIDLPVGLSALAVGRKPLPKPVR